MLAILFKELHTYCNSAKYRRIQLLVLCAFALLLFLATSEFHDRHRRGETVDVGYQVYTLFILSLFITQFLTPRHAVEAWHAARRHRQDGGHADPLLALAPLAHWRILVGKLGAVVVWAAWGIWLTVPLLALSIYIGGVPVSHIVKSAVLLLATCLCYACIGSGFALWCSPTQAKSVSYAIVLFTAVLPLVPAAPFNAVPLLKVLSPLCGLLSVFNAAPNSVWLWNIGLFCGLSLLLFPLLLRQMRL